MSSSQSPSQISLDVDIHAQPGAASPQNDLWGVSYIDPEGRFATVFLVMENQGTDSSVTYSVENNGPDLELAWATFSHSQGSENGRGRLGIGYDTHSGQPQNPDENVIVAMGPGTSDGSGWTRVSQKYDFPKEYRPKLVTRDQFYCQIVGGTSGTGDTAKFQSLLCLVNPEVEDGGGNRL